VTQAGLTCIIDWCHAYDCM